LRGYIISQINSQSPNLVKVENQIKLAHVVKVFVQHLHKVVDGLRMARMSKLKRILIGRLHLEVIEIVVTDVYADAEVQTSIPSVDNLEVAKLNEVCVLCVSYSHH